MLLKVKLDKREDGVVALILEGSIDTETYVGLKQKISSVIAMSPRVLIFDMEKVDYISSMGIGTVIETKKQIELIGGHFMMTNLQPQVKKVFEIVETLPDLNMFESTEEADEYLFRIQEQMKGKAAEKEIEKEEERGKKNKCD